VNCILLSLMNLMPYVRYEEVIRTICVIAKNPFVSLWVVKPLGLSSTAHVKNLVELLSSVMNQFNLLGFLFVSLNVRACVSTCRNIISLREYNLTIVLSLVLHMFVTQRITNNIFEVSQ
jgi:hypothetical protein